MGRHVSRKREAMSYFSIESALALIVSLFINVFVVTVFAKVQNAAALPRK